MHHTKHYSIRQLIKQSPYNRYSLKTAASLHTKQIMKHQNI